MVDYDIVIIGGSSTGRYGAALAAARHLRVALVEPQQTSLIGQCCQFAYNQALVQFGQTLHQTQHFPGLNLHQSKIEPIQWDIIQQWAQGVVANLETEYDLTHLAQLGVDVILGQGEFLCQPHLIFGVNGRQLRSRYYLLATGSKPKIPAIEGLEFTGFLTTETLYKLSDIPAQLAIIGGDPSGVELAQTFARFGSEVTLIVQNSQILGKEDSKTAHYLQACLEAEGIKILTHTEVTQTKSIQGKKWIQAGNRAIEVDEILVTAGTQPQLNQMNLKAAGVGLKKGNLIFNQRLQTTNPNIYGCGDLAGGYNFEQIARYEAKVCLENMFSGFPCKVNYLGIPWMINTDPQWARVGLTEWQAKRYYGEQVLVWQEPFLRLSKAHLLGETTGFYQLIAHRSGKILGASVVGQQASEIIGMVALGIRQGLKVDAIAQSPQIWLSGSQINHQVATAWLQHYRQPKGLLNRIKALFC